MKAIVETFVLEEQEEVISKNINKWYDLVSELNLTGQSKLISSQKLSAFMPIDYAMYNVFKTLFPSRSTVRDFSKSPIPIEILELIAKLSSDFDEMQIWYDEKNINSGVCVGIQSKWYAKDDDGKLKEKFDTKEEAKQNMVDNGWTKNEPETWFLDNKEYLIGKWSDRNYSFNELKEMAKDKFLEDGFNALQIEVEKKFN